MNETTQQEIEESGENKKRSGGFLWELVKLVFFALIIVVPVRAYVASPFLVSGASMEPTFETGNYLIVDELSYYFENPARGDVIVFRYPKDPSKFFIKRVVGLPGETLSAKAGILTIKNATHLGGFALEEPYVEFGKPDVFTITLGTNEYFVMGDNRGSSSDSRTWGTLPAELITGRALVRLFPVTNINIFPGKAVYQNE